jgi:hypothetical protein
VKKLRDETRNLVLERIAEGAREAALLWFVFSALDALISGRLTVVWGIANSAGAIGVWIFAIYVEIYALTIRPKEHS